MSELEDRLNSILNDPDALGKITQMASSIFGGDQTQPNDNKMPEGPGLDPRMLKVMNKLMNGGEDDSDHGKRQRALLEAMKPYLAEKRRKKMDKAMQIARMARLAEFALGEMGDGGDGL